MRYPDARLLLFVRRPERGRVKTRIARRLGVEVALELYRALLADSLRRLVDSRLAPVECWCWPDCDHPDLTRWADRVGLYRQRGKDLGERMRHAAERAPGIHLLLGTDCPDLRAVHLQQALGALAAGTDLVIGPALDGGYVLLGQRRVAACLFEDMPWGGSEVAALTQARAAALGWRIESLAPLRDIDEVEDLITLGDDRFSVP